MNPLNTAEAREAFLASPIKAAPAFRYKASARRRRKRLAEFPVHRALYKDALRIVEATIRTHGSYTKYMNRVWGSVVSMEQAGAFFRRYLKQMGLDGQLQVRFSASAVAGTSVGTKWITLKDPSTPRTNRLRSTCDHELGTHYLRRWNDQHQPWHGASRAALGVRPPSLETEEGLASIHSHLVAPDKRLFGAALNYCTAIWAQDMNFVQLYEFLAKYVDSNEKRWQQTLRVKRGLADQSQTGAYCKDQVYFVGAHRLLKSRRHIDFQELYAGRIPIESLHQCIRLRKGRAARSYAASTGDTGTAGPRKAVVPSHSRRLSAGSDSSSGGSDTSCGASGAGAGAGAGAREPVPKVLELPHTQSASALSASGGVLLPAVRGSQPSHGVPAGSARQLAQAVAPAVPRAASARLRPHRPVRRRTGGSGDSDGSGHGTPEVGAFGGKSARGGSARPDRSSHLPPVKLPPFMRDMAAYMRQLDQIAAANGIK